jgi:ribosomal protein L11 methyltransferase
MTDADRLFRFTLIVPAALADLAVAELWDLAPEGFEEHEDRASDGDGPGVRYVLYASAAAVDALAAGLQELVERLAQQAQGGVSLEADDIPDQNWREAWKVHFTLQRVPPFVIRPSWIEYEPAPGEHVIHLDPGSAFGTGLHESTRLCLRALAAVAAEGTSPGRVLDFGTGTGILGIGACRLFPCEVVAVDDDPLALTACDENIARNGVRERFALALALPPDLAPVGLTLANVSRPVLVEHAAALVAATVPGGALVLSGLLVGDEAAVVEAFAGAGATLRERTQENDWIALRLQRSPAGAAAGGATGAEG